MTFQLGLLEPSTLLWLITLPFLSALLFWRETVAVKRCKIFNFKRNVLFLSRIALPTLIIAILIFCFSRPYSGYEDIEIKKRSQDVLYVLDVSLSMLAEDVKPSRLEFAKRKALKLTDYFESSKNNQRLGIVLFAGSAYLYTPLTEDYEVIKAFIKQISPRLIESRGSALTDAINISINSLKASKSDAAKLVLFSDGEDNEIELASASALIADAGLSVYTFGFGTKRGSPIRGNHEGYLKDFDGNIIHTVLNEEALLSIAQNSGGQYYQASLNNNDIQSLANILSDNTGQGESKGIVRNYNELSPYILAGLLLALFSLSIYRKELFLIHVALALMIVIPKQAEASPREAYKAYKAQDFEKAKTLYEELLEQDPNNKDILHSLGSTHYKLEEFEKASEFYKRYEEQAKTTRERYKAKYNSGNAQLSNQKFEEAISSYEEALKLKPDDKNTKHNLEAAKKLLEQKKEQEQQQDQDKQQDEEQEDSSKEQPQSKDQEQEQEDSSQKDDKEKEQEKDSDEKQEQEQEQEKPTEDEEKSKEKDEPKESDENKENTSPSDSESLEEMEKSIETKEAEAWLDSLPESPIGLKKSVKPRAAKGSQTW